MGAEPDAARRQEVSEVLRAASEWAVADEGIRAVGVVGSWARGDAHDGSDVDLVVLAEHPGLLIEDRSWYPRFGDVELVGGGWFGVLAARRLRRSSGLEIDVGIVPLSWAATDPVDPGTAHIVGDGLSVLSDVDGRLARLLDIRSV
jgi:uncharacterized protein